MRERPREGPPIVVVEDDDSGRELIVRCLEKARLRNPVTVAGDGHHAVELLEGMDLVPALVFLDVQLPGQSGLDVLSWIRQQPRMATVPVVMLTGSSQLADVDHAHELGISSYLVKPVGFGAIQDVLGRLTVPWMLLTSDREV